MYYLGSFSISLSKIRLIAATRDFYPRKTCRTRKTAKSFKYQDQQRTISYIVDGWNCDSSSNLSLVFASVAKILRSWFLKTKLVVPTQFVIASSCAISSKKSDLAPSSHACSSTTAVHFEVSTEPPIIDDHRVPEISQKNLVTASDPVKLHPFFGGWKSLKIRWNLDGLVRPKHHSKWWVFAGWKDLLHPKKTLTVTEMAENYCGPFPLLTQTFWANRVFKQKQKHTRWCLWKETHTFTNVHLYKCSQGRYVHTKQTFHDPLRIHVWYFCTFTY